MRIPISVTSDFVCPWCYIGERRLARAIERLPAGIEVQLQWLPFELNPDMPAQGMDRRTYLTRKFGWDRAQAMQARIVLAPIVTELRRSLDEPTYADYGDRKLLAQLKLADKNRARFALILGSDELAAGEAVLRDLELRSDRRVPFASVRVLVELLVEAGI